MITKFKKQKKKKSRNGITPQIIFLVGIFAIGGLLLVSIINISRKRAALITELESLQREIFLLEGESEVLEVGISQTEEDSYWEEKAREQGYIKEGENPVVVVPSAESQEEETGHASSETILDKVKNFLAGVVEW